jgi:hypothetical protein
VRCKSTELTLLSADFVAPLLAQRVTMLISTVDRPRDVDACGAVTSAARSAGTLRDGCSAFQIRISVSPLPVSRCRQQAGVEEANATQVGAIKVGAIQHGLEQVGPGQARARERRPAQHRSTKIGLFQLGSGEVGAAQIETSQAGTGQVRRHLRVLGAPTVPFPNT